MEKMDGDAICVLVNGEYKEKDEPFDIFEQARFEPFSLCHQGTPDSAHFHFYQKCCVLCFALRCAAFLTHVPVLHSASWPMLSC